jgi:hypothetical protein
VAERICRHSAEIANGSWSLGTPLEPTACGCSPMAELLSSKGLSSSRSPTEWPQWHRSFKFLVILRHEPPQKKSGVQFIRVVLHIFAQAHKPNTTYSRSVSFIPSIRFPDQSPESGDLFAYTNKDMKWESYYLG